MTCLEKYMKEYPNGFTVEELIVGWCPDSFDIMRAPRNCPRNCSEEDCAECWNREVPGTKPSTTDAVNHPKHYGREGAMECIDEMVLVFGVEATKHFCLLNAWKYRYRAGAKGGEEDLRKSDWYLAKFKELKGDD